MNLLVFLALCALPIDVILTPLERQIQTDSFKATIKDGSNSFNCKFTIRLDSTVLPGSTAICSPKKSATIEGVSVKSPTTGNSFEFTLKINNKGRGKLLKATWIKPTTTTVSTITTNTPLTTTTTTTTDESSTTGHSTISASHMTTNNMNMTTPSTSTETQSMISTLVSNETTSSTTTTSARSTTAPSLEKLSICLTLKSHCKDPDMVQWMDENCATVCKSEVAGGLGKAPEGLSLKGLNQTFLGNVYVNGNPVCDDKWDLLDAQVVCNQLGLGPAIAATKRGFFGVAEGEYVIDNVECLGSENNILDCDLSTTPNCDQNEAAGVICSRVDVKEGHVFLDELPICSSSWTVKSAKVVCRQLGFSNGIVPPDENSTIHTIYHQKSFNCSGLEQNLLACPIVDSNCTGQQAKVTCSGPSRVKLVGGEDSASGNVYFMNGPVCDDNWDLEDGHVVCRELGFLSAMEITRGSYFGEAYRDFSTNNVQCTGNETALEFCQRTDSAESFCSGNEAAGVFCNSTENDLSHGVTKRSVAAAATIVNLGTEVLNALGLDSCNKNAENANTISEDATDKEKEAAQKAIDEAKKACSSAKKDILNAVLNLWTNQHAAIQAEREALKKEVMASGKQVTSNIMSQALEGLKLSDISFSKNQKATIEVDQKKGYVSENGEFKQGGLSFSLDYEKDLANEHKEFTHPLKFANGLGAALLTNCFREGEGLGDPCNEVVDHDIACIDMLEGAAYIGVGYDGRGDYTCNDRKKSLIQRTCGSKNFYQGEQVPDAMNVWGVYDSQCYGKTFRSLQSYQDYLIEYSGIGSQHNALKGSTSMFSFDTGMLGTLVGLGGGADHGNEQMSGNSEQNVHEESSSSSYQHGKKQLNFKYSCDVKRYNVFMDEVKPDDLSPAFLQDYLALPWSVWGAGAAQKYSDFIQRWGTHYIKSAVLGGKLSIFRSSLVEKSVSSAEWTEKTSSQTKNMFAKSTYTVANIRTGLFGLGPGGSAGSGTYSGESSQTASESASQGGEQAENENMYMVDNIVIEGGSTESVAMVTEEYKSGFRGDLKSWLRSIPRWPKPYDFKFGSICDLLDINYRGLLTDAIQPCWNLPLTDWNNMTFYTYTVKNNETKEEEERKRQCYFSGVDDFEQKMKHKRQSLCQAIDIFIEEGPLTSTSETIPGGRKNCEIDSKPKNKMGMGIKYTDIVDSGDLFAVNFDLPQKIKGRISQFAKILIKFEKRAKDQTQGFWYVVQPDGTINTRDISYNHNSGKINPDKPLVSIYGVVFNYDDDIGTLYFTNETCWLNKQDAFAFFENDISCENDIDWINRPLAKVLEHDKSMKPSYHSCNIKWTNSHMFNPSKDNGCIRFTAASEGPIYFSAAAVPARPDSWYTVRISSQDVTVYKGSERLKQETADISAVGLGSLNIYQTYFICLKHFPGKVSVSGRKRNSVPRASMNIIYGKLAGDESLGDEIFSHGYLTAVDEEEPIIPYYYAFGAGESLVKIVDVQVTDMPSHSCSGDTVFVEGKGCRQACPLYEITQVNSQVLTWECSKENGETYNSNSTHILADHTCELVCPENYLPHPYPSTVCQNDGSWRNGESLGCVKACPALEELKGFFKQYISASVIERNLLTYQTNCYHTENGIAVLGQPAEGNYHFEDEYCEITCGIDESGYQYTASHARLVCHDHQWVTETLQAATPTCTASPCLQTGLVKNAEIECLPAAVTMIMYNEGTVCRVTSCDANYFAPLVNSKATCNDNAWDAVLKCQLSQNPCLGPPPHDANSQIVCDDDDVATGGLVSAGGISYFDGTKCTFSCNSGWVTKPGSSKPEVQCNNGAWENLYTCVKVIDGNWSPWGGWTKCQSDCRKSRVRSCTNPAPENGGADCVGSAIETTGCAENYCVIDGGWGLWQSWSACSAACGGGSRSRTRPCNNPAPVNGGESCSGVSSESSNCNANCCPIDGRWASWTAWSTCNKRCGGGTKTRTRSCNSRVPSCGGRACPGKSSENLSCNTQCCAVSGGWSSWGSWSNCFGDYNNCRKSRSKSCNNPSPQCGGNCPTGSSYETSSCSSYQCNDPCHPVDQQMMDKSPVLGRLLPINC